MSETSSRLLELLALLQARRDWPGAELAERLGVSARTIRRDVERLRELGYPVESVSGPAGGYRCGPGPRCRRCCSTRTRRSRSPSACAPPRAPRSSGIEETAVRALVKLEQVLPAHLRRRVGALGSATIAPPAGRAAVDPGHLTVIAAACRDSERVRFAYTSRDGERDAARGRAALAGQPRPPLVPGRLGPRPRGLAHLPRRPPRPPGGDRGPLRAARAARARRLHLRRAQHLRARRAATKHGSPLHASAEEMQRRFPPYWGRFEPLGAEPLRVPPRRRRPRLAGDADRDARRRLRGPRAAGADRAPARAGAAACERAHRASAARRRTRAAGRRTRLPSRRRGPRGGG